MEMLIGGRYYEDQGIFEEVESQKFYTGLLLPHERDPDERPLLASGAASGIRDAKDIKEILDDPNRTPAEAKYPAEKWIRSQGQVGSCAGYAAAWTLARARVNAGHSFVPLSGESVYSQANGGRDRGAALINCINALVKVGAAPEGLNVAGKFYTESSLPAGAKAQRHRFRAFEWHQVKSDFELAVATATGHIIGGAIHVGPGWNKMNGDVLVGNNGPGNHAVLIDDLRIIGSETFEHRVSNSHSIRWGKKGSAWCRWTNHFSGPIRNHTFYALREVTDDPEGDNPPAFSS